MLERIDKALNEEILFRFLSLSIIYAFAFFVAVFQLFYRFYWLISCTLAFLSTLTVYAIPFLILYLKMKCKRRRK